MFSLCFFLAPWKMGSIWEWTWAARFSWNNPNADQWSNSCYKACYLRRYWREILWCHWCCCNSCPNSDEASDSGYDSSVHSSNFLLAITPTKGKKRKETMASNINFCCLSGAKALNKRYKIDADEFCGKMYVSHCPTFSILWYDLTVRGQETRKGLDSSVRKPKLPDLFIACLMKKANYW